MGVDWSASHTPPPPTRSTWGQRSDSPNSVGGWVGPRADQNVFEYRTFLGSYCLMRCDTLLTVNLLPTFWESCCLHVQDKQRPLLRLPWRRRKLSRNISSKLSISTASYPTRLVSIIDAAKRSNCRYKFLAPPVGNLTTISQTTSSWSGLCVDVYEKQYAVRVWKEFVRESLWRMFVTDMTRCL